MPLFVRDASRLDLAALLAINHSVQALHFTARPDQFKPVDPGSMELWLLQTLENPAARVWVAELDGTVIGSAIATRQERAEGTFVPAQRWWYVDQIGVLPTHHRKGACRALVEHIVAEAKGRGITQIELNSWAFNRDAHAVFRKLGFVPKHVRFELREPRRADDA